MSRRLVPAIAALTLAASGLAVAISPADARPADVTIPSTGSDAVVKTPYALLGSGYGTQVSGGQIPVNSGTTSFTSTGCTARTGVEKSNTEAASTLPGGLGTVGAVDTQLFTRKDGNRIGVVSKHSVAGVTLNLGGQASLGLSALTSTAFAYHNKTGFHSQTETTIGGLSITIAGVTQTLPLPTPNTPIAIPGLATISLGKTYKKTTDKLAVAQARAVQIDVTATGSRVRVAGSYARMESPLKSGRLGGSANTTRIAVLGDLITSGKTLQTLMPCVGTDGQVQTQSAAAVNLADQIVIGAAESSQKGTQTAKRAWGYEQAKVASVNLGNGALVINAIQGRAYASRVKGKGVFTSSAGTTIGSITANGTEQAIPDPGQSLTIPGVASITPNVVEKIKDGIHVIALQITLLDGTGAVINIGEAKMKAERY